MTYSDAERLVDEASQSLARAGRQVVFTAKRTTRAYTVTMTVDGREHAVGKGKNEMDALASLAGALQRRAA